MTCRHTALASSLPTSPTSAPPTEFRIWPFGEIATTKGTFLFDRAAARSVLDAWRTYGNRLTIDYEHKAVDPERRAGDGKSAGSFVLELRPDGLYAVDVRWTPPAFAALSNKEWLYFSPYFSAEEDSGRILEIINLALTNIPATRNMTPLVAASRSTHAMEDDKKKKEETSAHAEGDDPPPASDEEKTAAKKAAKERLAKLRAALAEAEEEYSSLSGHDDETGAPSSEEDETLAGDDEEEEEEEEEKPAAASAVTTAKPGGVTASRIVAAACAATGKTDPSEVVGALTALSKTQRTNVSLSKRIGELERKLLRGDIVAMVNAAIKSGKLTPAEREWALSYGMESPGKLKGYLDVTPQRAVIAGSEPREARAATTSASGGAQFALSDTERRICENAGIDPVKFAEAKNRPIRFSEG